MASERRNRSIRLAVAAATVVGLASTSGAAAARPEPAARPRSAAPEPVSGGHLTVSGEAEVANPWLPSTMLCDAYCYVRARMFFDQLAVFGDDGEVHGWLASSIEPNDDYSQWTITLREGVTFTDGTPVDADAVMFNLQETGTSLLVQTAVTDVAKVPDPENPERTLLKMEKVDDLTFTIFTGRNGDPEQPITWTALPHLLTGQWGLIASPQWLRDVKDDAALATQPVGSGPFTVESYAPREALELVRNPDYWVTDADGEQLPYLDSITFRVIEDSQVAYEALQNGDIDLMSSSNATAIADALADGEHAVSLQDDYAETAFLLIDLAKPPFDDRRVRCALSMAIDREEVIETGGSETVIEAANGVFGPGQQGYLEDNGFDTAQDLETAAALIEEYEAEVGDVAFTLGHVPSESIVILAEQLQGWWSEIGADVQLQSIIQGDLITNAIFGTPQFQIFAWRQHGGVLIDEQYLWWHSKNAKPDGELSLNMARIDDPDIDAGLDAARSALTAEEAQAAAEDVNRAFAEQCYNIPLTTQPFSIISRPGVGGVDMLDTPEGAPLMERGGMVWLQSVFLAEE